MTRTLWRDLCSAVSWMNSDTQNEDVVTVRPGARKGWIVSVERGDGNLPFSTRQLALEFARAYARLRRASAVQVVNEKGILEYEEAVRLPAARQSSA